MNPQQKVWLSDLKPGDLFSKTIDRTNREAFVLLDFNVQKTKVSAQSRNTDEVKYFKTDKQVHYLRGLTDQERIKYGLENQA